MERPPAPVLATLLVVVLSITYLAFVYKWMPDLVTIPFTQAPWPGCLQRTAASAVFSSQTQWKDYWSVVCNLSTPPQVNFTSEMVIAVWMGQKPNTGYSISITRVTWWVGRMVYVEVTQYLPGTCGAFQKIVYPSFMAIIPRIDAPFTFSTQTLTRNC